MEKAVRKTREENLRDLFTKALVCSKCQKPFFVQPIITFPEYINLRNAKVFCDCGNAVNIICKSFKNEKDMRIYYKFNGKMRKQRSKEYLNNSFAILCSCGKHVITDIDVLNDGIYVWGCLHCEKVYSIEIGNEKPKSNMVIKDLVLVGEKF